MKQPRRILVPRAERFKEMRNYRLFLKVVLKSPTIVCYATLWYCHYTSSRHKYVLFLDVDNYDNVNLNCDAQTRSYFLFNSHTNKSMNISNVYLLQIVTCPSTSVQHPNTVLIQMMKSICLSQQKKWPKYMYNAHHDDIYTFDNKGSFGYTFVNKGSVGYVNIKNNKKLFSLLSNYL